MSFWVCRRTVCRRTVIRLARKLFFEIGGYKVDSYVEEFGETVGETLACKPHEFLTNRSRNLLDSGKIKGLAHITGGGFLENIPRILPENVSVEIKRGTWTELPDFRLDAETRKC